MAREFDSPWKDALDLFLEWVLAFFFPDLHARIDWSKGYENLGAELSEIVRQAELGPTAADKLFRVCLIDGAKAYLLIQLYERGWTPEGIRQVYRLVDWFLELPKELDEQLKNDLHAYEEERCMPYVTSIERLALEEGEKKGRKEGEKKGRKEGEKKGRKKGREEGRAAILDLVQPVLASKFGKRGSALAKDLHAVLDLDKIQEISHEILFGSKTIDELRAMLP